MTDSDLVQRWRRVLAEHAAVSCALERALHEHELSVSEFEALERLVESPGQLRIQELADELHLSQSATTRVVARLEAAGLLSRSMCASDRRGVNACVSDAGRARYSAARAAHRRVLADELDGAVA